MSDRGKGMLPFDTDTLANCDPQQCGTSGQLVPDTSNSSALVYNGQVYVDPDSSGYVNNFNIYNASGGRVHIGGGGGGTGGGIS
ncbi:MAG: hypothetical protein Q9172_007851, partial [Xanthocarpia lactea]